MGKMQSLGKMVTPTWAAKQLPENVEVVRIAGRWWMMIWSDNDVCAQPDPEKWCYSNGELGDNQEVEMWIPPTGLVAGLADDLFKEATAPAPTETNKDKHHGPSISAQ